MNDADYAKQKARVKKVWDKWCKPLGLGWFLISVYWERERDEDEPRTIAKTSSNWQYHTASVSWFLPEVAEIDDDRLELSVVHEAAHILVAPTQDFSSDAARQMTEHAVSTVAQALIWAREAGEKK